MKIKIAVRNMLGGHRVKPGERGEQADESGEQVAKQHEQPEPGLLANPADFDGEELKKPGAVAEPLRVFVPGEEFPE